MFLGRRHPKDARTNINLHIEMDSRPFIQWEWTLSQGACCDHASGKCCQEVLLPMLQSLAVHWKMSRLGHLVAGRFYWEVWKYQLYLVDMIYEDGTLALADTCWNRSNHCNPSAANLCLICVIWFPCMSLSPCPKDSTWSRSLDWH